MFILPYKSGWWAGGDVRNWNTIYFKLSPETLVLYSDHLSYGDYKDFFFQKANKKLL